MIQVFKNTHFKFMKYKYFAFLLSGILITVGIVNLFIHKGLNYGVDFAGGTLIRILFKDPAATGDIRQALRDAGLGNSRIQELGKEGREYLIRTLDPTPEAEQELEAHEILGNKVIETLRTEEGKVAVEQGLRDLNSIDEKSLAFLLEPSFPDEFEDIARNIISYRVREGIIHDFSQLLGKGISQEVIQRLQEKVFLGRLTVLSRETVGPQVGHDLRKKATLATVWALIGMLIYIGIRFKFAYGVAAVLTLAHDVLVTVGIFSLTNREINLPGIAAVMTIVGYSLNDTIVIFDRVRDNLKILRKHRFEDILDVSINQTMSRTIITSGTTLLTVTALFLFGGEVINDFAFMMIIGIICGTYSTIYQSCPIVAFWQKLFKPKKGFRK